MIMKPFYPPNGQDPRLQGQINDAYDPNNQDRINQIIQQQTPEMAIPQGNPYQGFNGFNGYNQGPRPPLNMQPRPQVTGNYPPPKQYNGQIPYDMMNMPDSRMYQMKRDFYERPPLKRNWTGAPMATPEEMQQARQPRQMPPMPQQKAPAQGLTSMPPKVQSNGMERVSQGLYRDKSGKLVRR